MTIRKKLKLYKETMNFLADLVVEEDNDDGFIVEILCRKLTQLGYLIYKSGYYERNVNHDK